MDQYRRMYQRSIDDPEGFWSEVANDFYFKQRWTKFQEFDFKGDSILVKYFIGAKTNVCYNALDRHLDKRGDQVAIIWEGNYAGEDAKLTYRQLHTEVCKFANVLKSLRRQEGRPRLHLHADDPGSWPIAMLACARIGAVHSVVFGGFSRRGPARPHPGLRLPSSGHRRRRAAAARKAVTAEGQRRRRHAERPVPQRQDLHRRPSAPAPTVPDEAPAATSGGTKSWPRPRPTASPSGWTPKTRCSSFTPPARPASPRACCTPPAATWSSRAMTHK